MLICLKFVFLSYRDEVDAWRWATTEISWRYAQALVWCWTCHQDTWQYPFFCVIWTTPVGCFICELWCPLFFVPYQKLHLIRPTFKSLPSNILEIISLIPYVFLIKNIAQLLRLKPLPEYRLWWWSCNWIEIQCQCSNGLHSQLCRGFCVEINIVW